MFNKIEMMYFKMALLYISRKKRRSFLISLMISFSLIGLLLMEGVYEGMMVQVTQNSIKVGSGTLSIQDKKFRAENHIKYHINDEKQIYSLLKEEKEIKSYVSRVKQQGLIATAGFSQGVSAIGVNLQEEDFHAQLKNFMIKGEYSFASRDRGAIIGYRLARKLRVDIGKKVILMMQDINNEVSSVALKISGIIKTNNIAIDSNGLIMEIDKLRNLIGIKGSTEIAILLKNQDNDYLVKSSILSKLKNKNITVYSYKELYPSLHEGEALMQTYNKISSAFIFIVATLGIFAVVLVSVLERVREFGIMMAIGTRFFDIARLIVYESLLITMSGYLIGAIIGGSLLWYFKVYGLDLSGYSDAFAIFGMDSKIHAILKQEYFTSAFFSVLLATIFATIIPIYSLKKKNPIQAINEQT